MLRVAVRRNLREMNQRIIDQLTSEQREKYREFMNRR
jgi:hypothetical protein